MNNPAISLRFRLGVIIIVALFLLFFSWQSDDAYHAYTMARNLVEGNGFVYIVGERVNATTCPLWTLMCAGVYALCGNMYAGTLILSVLLTSAAFAFIAYRCTEHRTLIFCATLFVCSPCLVFGVSGLENSLLFFLSGILLHQLLSHQEQRRGTELFFIALLMALLAWTRMDIVLLFAPVSVCVFLKQRHPSVSFITAVGIAMLGLLPFIFWLVFSTWYYGFPFPNTAYAKLSTLLPRSYYLTWGMTYMVWSFLCYIAIPVALGLSFYLCFRKASRALVPISLCAGVGVYLIYITNVGGDFMLGRHYSVILYLCLFLIAHQLAVTPLSKQIPLKLTCGVFIFSCISISVSMLNFFYEAPGLSNIIGKEIGITYSPQRNILNSSGYCMEITWWGMGHSSWLFHPERFEKGIFQDSFGNPSNKRLSSYCYANVQPPLPPVKKLDIASGCIVYHVGSSSHLIDAFGLGDALIARLQSSAKNPRIGHVARKIPEGYIESLESGENKITDPKIHEFYNHLKVVISGDLFSKGRLLEIWRFNTGQYSDLTRS